MNTSDISTKNGCSELIETANKLGPVGGIFNLAVKLVDAIFENQNEEKFVESMKPKANGESCDFQSYPDFNFDLHLQPQNTWMKSHGSFALNFTSLSCSRRSRAAEEMLVKATTACRTQSWRESLNNDTT